MTDFTYRRPQSGYFFSKLGHFSNFQKRQGRPPTPLLPSSYTSVLFLKIENVLSYFSFWTYSGFRIVGKGAGRGLCPLHPTIFLETPIKTNATDGVPPSLQNEAPSWKANPSTHWNVKHPSMKWFLEKAQ